MGVMTWDALCCGVTNLYMASDGGIDYTWWVHSKSYACFPKQTQTAWFATQLYPENGDIFSQFMSACYGSLPLARGVCNVSARYGSLPLARGACNQEVAVQWTFDIRRSSFFYLSALDAALPCLYCAHNCTEHTPDSWPPEVKPRLIKTICTHVHTAYTPWGQQFPLIPPEAL